MVLYQVDEPVTAVHHVVREQAVRGEGEDRPGTLDPRIEATWERLDTAERKAVLATMVARLAARDDFEYRLDWTSLSDDTWEDEEHPGITWGSWDDNGSDWNPFDKGRMSLNPNALDDPVQMIDTVAHEARHAVQHRAATDVDRRRWPWREDPFADDARRGITKAQARRWKRNFAEYRVFGADDSGEEDFDAYHGQPVEVDARVYAHAYVNRLTDREFERMLKESR